MSIEVVSIGSVAVGDATTAVTVPLPPSYQAKDFLLCFSFARATTGTPTMSVGTGWTQNNHSSSGNFKVLTSYRVATGVDDGSPIVTPHDMSAPQKTMHFCVALRYVNNSSPIGANGTFSQNASQEDIGAITAPTASASVGAAIVLGCRLDSSWTSVATLSGDSITWTELIEAKDNTVGSALSIVVDIAPWTGGAPTLTNKTFNVSGATAVGAGMFVLLNGATTQSIPVKELAQTTQTPTINYKSPISVKALAQTGQTPTLAKRYAIPKLTNTQTVSSQSLSKKVPVNVRALTQTLPLCAITRYFSAPVKAFTQTRYAPTLAHNTNSPKLTFTLAGQSPVIKKNYSIPILAITATKYAPSIPINSPIEALAITQNCRDVTVKNHYAVPIIVLIEALHNPLFLLTLPVNELVQSLPTPKVVKTFNIPSLVWQHTNTTIQLKKNIQVSVRNTIQAAHAPALGKTCPVLSIVCSTKQIQPTLNAKAEKLTTQLQLLLPRLGGGLTLQFSVSLPHPTVFYGGVQIDTLQVLQLFPEGRFAHEPIEIPRLSLRQTTYTPEYRLLDYKGSTSWRIKQKRKARRRRHYERQSMMIAFRMDPKAVTVKQLFHIPAVAIAQVNQQPQTIRENAGLSIVQYNHAPNTILNTPIEVFSVIQSEEAPSLSSFSSNIPVLSIIETISAPTIGANNRNIDKLVFTQRVLMPAVAAPIIRVIQNNINPFIVNKYNTTTATYIEDNRQPSIVLKNNSPKLSFVQSNKTITVTIKYNSDARQILQTLYPPDTLFRIRLNVPVYLSTQVLKSPTLIKLYGIPYIGYGQTNSAPRLVRRYPIPPLFFTFVGLQPSIQTIPPEYAVKSIAEDRVIYYFAEDRVIMGYLGDRTIASPEEIRNVERV